VLHLETDRQRLVMALLAATRLTGEQALDDKRVDAEAATVLQEWVTHWLGPKIN
jgi:hypothetical protein